MSIITAIVCPVNFDCRTLTKAADRTCCCNLLLQARMDANPAADLLQWLDMSNDVQVMDKVQRSLQSDRSSLPVPVALEVDLMSLMCDDAELAMNVMQNIRSITNQAQAMINQQLEATHAATEAGLDTDPNVAPPTVRLSLKMIDAPLPLSTPSEVRQHTLSMSSHHPTAPSQGLLVSCLGVVVGASAPVERTYSSRIMCPACGTAVDVLAEDGSLPCCNLPKTPMMQEDLTGRVMIPSQQLWISGLSSAAGASSYGCSSTPLLVHVPEHQVSLCSLGAVVHLTGHSKTYTTTATAASVGCGIQVTASNIKPLLPHMLWAQQPSSCTLDSGSNSTQHCLQHLWELLSTALGCQTLIDPHVAVSMLLSAAVVGGRDMQQRGTAEQVNVLYLHDRFASPTLRLLQGAAALLSPQSVFMPVQQAEHVNPITKDTSGSGGLEDPAAKPVYASILHLANTGVAVADLSSLPTKIKQQLLNALQQRATPPLKAVPAHMQPPMTATCWAAAAWQDVNPAAGSGDEILIRPVKQSAAAASITYNGFDLCLGDQTCHEEEVFWLLDKSEASAAQQLQLQQSEQQAAGILRQLIAAAALCKPPVLSDAAQTFLGQYFLVLRQSLESSNKVSKPMLLASLVRLATAVARLHNRSLVIEQPDAALAVVLMEQTLSNKLGDAYRSLLELPADLHPSSGRSLDDQMALLHGIMCRTFRQYCCTGDEEMFDGAGDSGCSGLGSGPDMVDEGFGLPDSQVEVGS